MFVLGEEAEEEEEEEEYKHLQFFGTFDLKDHSRSPPTAAGGAGSISQTVLFAQRNLQQKHQPEKDLRGSAGGPGAAGGALASS